MIRIEKVNSVYIRVTSDPSIEREIQDTFTFKIPNFRFTPAGRAGWNGDIKLYNRQTKLLYAGLLYSLLEFAKRNDYPVSLKKEDFPVNDITVEEVNTFLDTLNIPPHIERREYQVDSIRAAIMSRRRTMLSPTASGKSFMIYALYRYFNVKTLLIVPDTGLVRQMAMDIKDYGYQGDVHMIYQGQDKFSDARITVSTWQSIYKESPEWFSQYEAVIVDEVHGAKADKLKGIMEKMTQCDIRIGFTGTLDGTTLNKLVIEGLFGPVKQVTESFKLMEEGFLSALAIKAIVLKYPEDVRKSMAKLKMTYAQELDYIVTSQKRRKFIASLAQKLEGNTLILFRLVEKHGIPLYEMIKEQVGDTRPVYLVYGDVDGEIRNDIRGEVENAENAIIVASFKTFSTGINIKRLHNLILGSPLKARIPLLQSIGRVLRKSNYKEKAILYDIADDLSWKSKKNYTLLHLLERVKIYNSEKFSYKLLNVEFKP
jgi:superfamily II DNA or RNA helicase